MTPGGLTKHISKFMASGCIYTELLIQQVILFDFMLSVKLDHKAAKRFFKKTLNSGHTILPRVINVYKNAAYPPALKKMKEERSIDEKTELRQIKCMNNLIEQDHRFIKRITKNTLGFQSFYTASRTIRGIETMHMLRKRQVHAADSPGFSRAGFVNELFKKTA